MFRAKHEPYITTQVKRGKMTIISSHNSVMGAYHSAISTANRECVTTFIIDRRTGEVLYTFERG